MTPAQRIDFTCPSCRRVPERIRNKARGVPPYDWRNVFWSQDHIQQVCIACAQTLEAEIARVRRETKDPTALGPFAEYLQELPRA